MPTTNPVPSQDPSDLLFNAGKLDEVVSGSNATYTDRLGISRRTVAGIDAAADVVLSGLGYAPPVAYASGIALTLTTQTVEYAGEVYAPKVASLPFTTSGTFETAKFRLVQGVASADLAASSGSSLIGYDTGTVQDVLDAVTGPTGAASVGYTPSGVGAVTTDVQEKLREYVNIANYVGFFGNGTDDDKTAVVAAADYCRLSGKGLYCPPGYNVKLSSSTSLKDIRNIRIESDIVISTGTLTVGGNVNNGKFSIFLQSVTNGTSTLTAAPPASPIVRVTGVTASDISIGACNYIQLYADASISNERFVAYNQFKLTGAVSLLELTDSGASLSYVNENAIYADRIIRYKVIGVGYAHNHNKLFHPCMEGANVEIVFSGNQVSANQVYGARFEGAGAAPGVTFGAGTYSNTVIGTWSGVGSPRAQFSVPLPVIDSGSGNMVTTEAAFQFRKTTLFSVGPNSQILSTATDTVAPDPRIAPANAGVNNMVNKAVIKPSLEGFYLADTFQWVALTDPIPVQLGDVIGFDADFDGSLVRTYIFVLDEDMEPLLDNSGGAFISQAATTFNATYGSYSPGANISALPVRNNTAAVIRPEVKYVRVGFTLGVAGFVRFFSAFLYTQALNRGKSEGAEIFTAARSLNGTPTQGYAPLNTLVYDSTANVTRRCSFQYETRVKGALAEGATSVAVAAISTVADSDVVGLLLDNGETHWTAVSGLAGSTFTIAAIPAGRTVPDGARIVFNRWASSALTGSATYNPGSLADGAGETTTLTVTGAALGDQALASFSNDLQGIILHAWVSSANTVSIRFQNETGGLIDLASGTIRVRVFKF